MKFLTEECPVCYSFNNHNLYHLDRGQLVSCDRCQTIFYTPRPTPEELASFYNTHEYRECYENSAMTGYNFATIRYQQLSKIVDRHYSDLLAKQDKHLLDIGCGEGDLLSVAKSNGWQITGTEISPEATAKANQLLPNRVLTGELINLTLPNNSYDLITIYHVIEHLLDPIPTIAKIQELLKPGGIAFIETPNIASLGAKIKGKNWSHIIPPEHITYFQPCSLKYALQEAGFDKFKIFTNAPYLVESIDNWSQPFKSIARTAYSIAPALGLGAALQAIAIKK
jgi:2-polyprenyl-3-methyl-5-hydroxy-6-metoxy-1,4-benzoquinol methylase